MSGRARFAKGSGCYTCRACQRRTRDTGGDNASLRLCAGCFDALSEDNAREDDPGPNYDGPGDARYSHDGCPCGNADCAGCEPVVRG